MCISFGSRLNGRVSIDNLQVLDLRVDAAKVFRQRADAVYDKRLGVASHAVFVVDGVLVVSRDKRIESGGAKVGVLCDECEAQYIGVFLVLHDIESANQLRSGAVHGRYSGKQFVIVVVVAKVRSLGDGNRAEVGIHLAAEACALPAAVFAASDAEIDFLIVAGAEVDCEWRGDLLERSEYYRRGVIDVHIAQIHSAEVIHIEVELAHHLVHDG